MGTRLMGKDFIKAMLGPLGLEGRRVKALTIRADVSGGVEVDITESVGGPTPAEITLPQDVADAFGSSTLAALARARSGGEY